LSNGLSPFFVIGIPTGMLGALGVCPFPFSEFSGGSVSVTSSEAELTLLFFLMPQVGNPFPEVA